MVFSTSLALRLPLAACQPLPRTYGCTHSSHTQAAEMQAEGHRLAVEEQRQRNDRLEGELTKLRTTYDAQQSLFHDSIAAANAQV